MSGVAARILQAVTNDNLELDELASVLQESPTLTARLLALANSSYFGRAGHVSNLRDAIIRVLGLNTVRSISLAYSLSGHMDLKRCAGFDAGQFWMHSVMTAQLALRLARHVRVQGAPSGPDAYTAGLLQRLGLLALTHLFPAEVSRALAMPDEASRLSQRLREQLQTDHHAAGALLARRWQLPDPLYRAIAHGHDIHYRDDHWPLTVLVGACSVLSKQLLAGQQPKPDEDLRFALLGIAPAQLSDALSESENNRQSLLEIAAILAQ